MPSFQVLVFGDSLSEPLGVPQAQGWVALLDARLRERGLPYRAVNRSVSGTTTGAARVRLEGILSDVQPSVLILQLGSNDAHDGVPLETIHENLVELVEIGRKYTGDVILVGNRIYEDADPQLAQRF